MLVRGAPLIGATAAYGMALAMRDDRSDAAHRRAPIDMLVATRPTAINLKWALERDARARCSRCRPSARAAAAYARADEIAEEDVAINQGIAEQRPGADRGDRRDEEAGRAGQCADPLQCRLARHRRLGHGDGADLSGA